MAQKAIVVGLAISMLAPIVHFEPKPQEERMIRGQQVTNNLGDSMKYEVGARIHTEGGAFQIQGTADGSVDLIASQITEAVLYKDIDTTLSESTQNLGRLVRSVRMATKEDVQQFKTEGGQADLDQVSGPWWAGSADESVDYAPAPILTGGNKSDGYSVIIPQAETPNAAGTDCETVPEYRLQGQGATRATAGIKDEVVAMTAQTDLPAYTIRAQYVPEGENNLVVAGRLTFGDLYVDSKCSQKPDSETKSWAYSNLRTAAKMYGWKDFGVSYFELDFGPSNPSINTTPGCRAILISGKKGATELPDELKDKVSWARTDERVPNPALLFLYYANNGEDGGRQVLGKLNALDRLIMYAKDEDRRSEIYGGSQKTVQWAFNAGSANGRIFMLGKKTCKGAPSSVSTAGVRPIATMNRDSVLFASKSSTPKHAESSTIQNASNRLVNHLVNTETDGYKLTVKDANMGVESIDKVSTDDNVVSLKGNNIILKPNATTLKLKVNAKGSGVSAPNKIAAYTTGTAKSPLFGEIGEVSGNTSEVTLDLANIMDTSVPGSKTISLYAEQENGAYKTDYMSEAYDITLVIPVDQTLGLKKDSVLEGTYGDDLTLTAIVNENETDRKWDPANELKASIPEGYKDIAEITSQTWDETTGTTEIIIKPLKSGDFKLKLFKQDDVDNGITVTNNNVETDVIKVEKRNVTLTAKAQTFTKYATFKPPEIEASYTYPAGPADADKTKAGLVNEDKLPLSGANAITVKTTNKSTSNVEEIPKKQVADVERLWEAGTWTQTVLLSAYNSGTSPLLDKYNFTPGSVTDYVVEDALSPGNGDIKITPACDYPDDTECWNKGTVTIEPSDTAKANGYTLIKNTTKADDQIDKNEDGFASSFTISTADITKLKNTLYNLKDPDKDLLSNQGTVGRHIRIDTTAPTKIDAKITAIPVVNALELTLKEAVAAVGGDASGIRFNKVPMEVKVTATDAESGVREVEAFTFNETGDSTEKLAITPVKDEFVENSSVPGAGSKIDKNITYQTKVYKIQVNANYKNSIKIVVTNNAGLKSEQVTNKVIYEDEEKAKKSMVLKAGAAAKTLAGEDGPFKITQDELKADDIKWPMKIQASYSGIKKISYYITDTDDTPLDGDSENPIDVTTTGYGITAPSSDLDWKSAAAETLDVEEHDQAVVSLKKAIEAVKEKGAATVKVHAKLESNAGNTLEKEFVIQALYQKIEWSDELQKADKNKDTADIEVEETYGNRITLSANMVDEANRWSGTGDFTITLADADKTKAKLLTPKVEAYKTTNNTSGTDKGKVTVELVPLTGNDTEVTLIAKKSGDSEYADSNEIKIKVKLKSKPLTVEADANTTYDVKTGEVHPKLTYQITDLDKKENDDALVKDTDAGIDDTAAEKKVDFLLKATGCVDATDCKIASLLGYEQGKQRINETGEWKLEFQYNKDDKTGDKKENIFNRKYDITFVDYNRPGTNLGTSKTLKVTQDSFEDTWYTITPDPDTEVKDDKDAWNTSMVTIQPTDQAVTNSTKTRTYQKIINDDLETANAPDTWGWVDSFTHTKDYKHGTETGTDAKTYKLRFRDPVSGAFTAAADAKRSVRVDASAPIKPFISVNKDDAIPADSAVAESGKVQGTRFSKDGLKLTVSMIDEESGMRSLELYTVEKGMETKIKATIVDEESTAVPGVNNDGKKAVRKKTATYTITNEFKGSVKIVGMNNAGQKTTYETGELINEPEADHKLSIATVETEDNKIPEKITRNTYKDSYVYPLAFKAPISGIKKIEYTMSVDDEQAEPVKELKSASGDITTKLGVIEVKDEAISKSSDEKTPTYEIGQTATAYGDYFSIKPYVDEMIKGKTDLGTIKIYIKLTSNAGNVIETETLYTLPVDLMLNDPENYLVVPKQVRLQRVKGKDIAQGSDKVELKTVTDKPAGLDITQYFNVYTDPKITLHKLEDESGRKHTYTVSVHDENDKLLTTDKNLLTSLNYPGKLYADFTLTTPLVKDPEKDKDRGEYRGLMEYKVTYGKQDTEKQPTVEVKP